MHFYEFNIGDYAKKTRHLTNEEDLAYRRALDMYYDTEKPLLTDGLATLSRKLGVDEKALKNVLDEFFPDGRNKHADEKIAAYYEYLEKQRANGIKGGRPKNKPTDNPSVSQNNPVPSQPLTTKPLTTDQVNTDTSLPPPAKADPIPYMKIVDLYHEILPSLPKALKITAKRKGQIAARWKSGDLPDLQTWKEYFEFCGKSAFLMGKCDPSPGRKRFMADLEWLTNETNFTKTWENKYHG